MSDLISRADAIEAVRKELVCDGRHETHDKTCRFIADVLLSALPSAEAVSRKAKCCPIAETCMSIDCPVSSEYIGRPSAEAKGDLISRQWLLDLYATPEDGDDVEWKVPLEVVRQNILDAPSAEAVQGDGRNNLKRYPNCQMRTSLGNCDAIGGFCTSINAPICDAFHKLTEAVQGWIPCSERLPSESDDYLCTIPLDANETYTEVLTFHKGRFYEDDDEWGATYHDDVIAWLPLPKPYKGGDDE